MNPQHPDLALALRLVLHAAGLEELLPPDQAYGDDLYDAGLLRVHPDNDAWTDLSPAAEDIIRSATGAVHPASEAPA